MSKADYLGQAVVRVAVLPARAAYLIRAASESGLRRAVQEACSRWGGMTEPIVSVKPDGEVDVWWQQVVTVARADLAVNVDVPDHDAAVTAQALGLELVTLAQISTGGVHPAFTGPAELPDRNGYVMGGENGPLWGAVAAGDLTAEHLADLSTDVLWVERAADDQLARAQLAGRTLIERTAAQFSEHWTSGGPGAFPAIIWVTEPGSFADCLYYWNLRALRPLHFQTVPMLLLPTDRVQNWLGFPGQLAHVLARLDEFTPDVALCSLSVDEDGLRLTAAELGLQQGTGDIRSGHRWPAPLRQAPFTYLTGIEDRHWFVFERSYGKVTEVDVQLFRDRTPVRFASPVAFSGEGQALVRLSGAPFAGLPRRPAVATRIFAGSAWSHDALQISTSAQNDYLVELHIPDLPEATNALLAAATARYELSDKGKLGTAWMDGTDISPLREPGVFAAIRDLTTPRSKELLRELLKLRAGGAVDDELAELAARWGGRRERRYRSAEGLEHVPTTDAPRVLEQLCGLGWAERGLGITCDTCGRPSFVAFPHATGRAACPGCASPARYDTGSALTVYYRLNSYLDQLSDQGVLPHLLAIAALECQGTRAYFLPGTNVWFADSDKDTAEADIFGIRDGQILAGEVKTTAAEFTADQIKRDADLSKRLGADVHVLAATDDISEGIAEIAKAQCDARGLGVIVLQREDLLPEASG